MEDIKRKLSIDNIIRYLIIFMTLFVSAIIVVSMLKKEFDAASIVIGMSFIFFLIFLKWIIKESGIE